MKSLNGLLVSIDEASIDRSSLLVAYNFYESGSIPNKAPNYSGSFDGTLSGDASFYFGSGTGYPQNHSVFIQNSGAYWSSNFTQVFAVERSAPTNDIFFSSLAETAIAASGYSVLSNDAGKLVFAFKDCHGPQAITSNFVLNRRAHFAVVKQNNGISLYQYTPVADILESSDGVVNGDEIFQSDYAELFYGTETPVGFIKDYFSGFCTDYLYFSVPLSANQIRGVVSGLYADMAISSTGTGGSVSGGFFVPPSAQIIVSSGTATNSQILSRDGIVMLNPVPSNSTIVLDYATGVTADAWNQNAIYSINDFYTSTKTNTPPVVYLNGQRVLSGVSVITGQYCATGRAYARDYTFSGRQQISDVGGYVDTDLLVYDISARHLWQNLSSGSSSVNIYTGSGIAVYLNGQRTTDYSISGTTLTLQQAITSGDIVCVDYYANNNDKIGEIHNSGTIDTSGAYVQGSSRVYLNGVRQRLGLDYIEIPSGTLLMGDPIARPTGLVVTFDSNFWNI